MFCAIQGDPTSSRVTILVALAVAYALYHLIRWYAARPKVEKEEIGRGQENRSTKDVNPSTVDLDLISQPQPPPSPPTSNLQPPTPTPSPHDDTLFSPDEIKEFEHMGRKAWSAGWLVEAHYWTALAEANGVRGLAARLDKLRRDWVRLGCPDEAENIHPGYNSTRAALAIAYMLFKTGMAPRENAAYIVKQARMRRRPALSLALHEKLING